MPKVGIVAAMRREIWPLVRSWRRRGLTHTGSSFELFESDLGYAIVAGIGAEAARRATEALLEGHGVETLISAGFAGALGPELRVGAVLTALQVVEAESGERFATLFGGGVLVTAAAVVRQQEKTELAAKYGAQAVDMEAAAVGRVAQRHGIGFLAVKGISEAHDFPLPPVERFVGADGRFDTGRFVLHTAMRPWSWGRIARLASGNRRAARTLCGVLDALLQVDDLRKLKGRQGKVRAAGS